MNKYKYAKNFKLTTENCFISDSFDSFSEAISDLGLKERRVLLVEEKKYSGFYLKQLSEILTGNCRSFDVFEMTEETPDFHLTSAHIRESAAQAGLTAEDCVISLGSVLADSAAKVFIAEYFSGTLYIKIPVTFIGQLLSTAEGDAELDFNLQNTPGIVLMPDAKMAGDIRTMIREVRPNLVFINISAFKYLDQTERISGVGEAMRCAVGSDAAFFQYLQANSGKRADDFYEFLLNMIMNCLRINKEKKSGHLKFGYTLARGIEKCTNYIIPHGQAVGIGIVVANNIAVNRKLLKDSEILSIAKCMVSYGLSVMMNFTNDLIDAICAALEESGDVSEEGVLSGFVLINKIGRCVEVNDVTLDEIRKAMFYR